jgi:uncharacterized membrane protein
MRAISIIAVVVVTACVALGASASSARAETIFHSLGALPGDSSSVAHAVSGNGQVVVGLSDNRSFRWTAAGGMEDLGLCPVGDGSYFPISSANGVSFDGSVVVGGASDNRYVEAPYRWTPGSGMVRLHDEMGYGRANDVSDNGYFAVGYQRFCGWRHPYANDDTIIPMFEGTFAPNAWGVSGDGQIVVGNGNWGPAFRWTAGSPVAEPLYAPVGWGTSPGANDISRDGTVIVGSAVHPDGPTYPCRWTAGTGGFEVLGTNLQGNALAVSGDGSVIVGSASGLGGLIWTAAGGLRPLQTVLVEDYGLNLDGWVIHAATDVSAAGDVIVGYGQHYGQYEGFVAVVPEPGTVVLLAAGLVVGLAVRRWFRH